MFNQLCVKAKIGFDKFMNDQKGVTAIEYAIVGVAISAIVLGVVSTSDTGLGGALQAAFDRIITNVRPTP
ncbi:Flp family type IVb pilin [Vibrio ponticus]|uniref:Flp family type IVb pilin n=1 Tax=Vibrio ponticus TaxID=265668 RepID=A0A3N3DTI3_9VIBR|nr:Flp family type IVb pilin [Vibrio ponticus]ROV57780.1 Flp family type IVb pilin [Vibrio ponticus]